MIISDGKRLNQIIANMIVNALKFTDRGRVMVNVNSTMIGDMSRTNVVIRDTGIGNDSVRMPTLFDAFSPGSSNGLGMGLTISKKLCDSLGCQLTCESVPDEGTTFSVTHFGKVANDCTFNVDNFTTKYSTTTRFIRERCSSESIETPGD